jgi:hypothetical protein
MLPLEQPARMAAILVSWLTSAKESVACPIAS